MLRELLVLGAVFGFAGFFLVGENARLAAAQIVNKNVAARGRPQSLVRGADHFGIRKEKPRSAESDWRR